ncbi:serine-tRNA synthetase [Blattabacterium sp. (Periplaneta americana) str. BPLAN]|uniref:serine--tRNA ligase n=1 Tax=Blattabacterium sp. (Periplaneta americana) TaxID=367488 RepID=UPI0001BA0BB7|nr:serine--tRNA ligase [Blattabacterium sp. (Periplaneta americana)]ACX83825.1 serine-tRNA synthetase [Blattabacterium sp. (Periplaneta americana) str. BPLAN]
MLQVSFIRKNREKILSGLEKRKFEKRNLIDEILILDKSKKKIQYEINKISENENKISKKISHIIGDKNVKKIPIKSLKEESLSLKKKKKNLHIQLKNIIQNLEKKLDQIPNIPDEIVKKNLEKDDFLFQKIAPHSIKIENALPHWELAKKFQLFDLYLGTKICGSGFPVYIGKGAKLQRGLIQYFLDKNIQASYKEYSFPYLINEISGYSTGQIPDKEGQMYLIEKDNFYLIPTGEIPLMNCYRNNLLSYKDLPIKSTTYTSCFRREAGSYGSKVRGLNRLHQFEKVEIIQITTPDTSFYYLEEMISHVQNILKSLELPFRLIRLMGKDLGFASAITYDFEVYSMAQKKWLEVSSISNCTNFQSNRLNLRYKTMTGKIELCHTLNGSALALPRIMAALLENNQTVNQINIPKVLVPYTGFDNIK